MVRVGALPRDGDAGRGCGVRVRVVGVRVVGVPVLVVCVRVRVVPGALDAPDDCTRAVGVCEVGVRVRVTCVPLPLLSLVLRGEEERVKEGE